MKIKNSFAVLQKTKKEGINAEFEAIDYKLEYHFSDQREKLELIKDIVSIANTDGGCIIYGVRDKSFEWVGLDQKSDDINDIQISDFLHNYISEKIQFQCGVYNIDNEEYYFITIQKIDGEIASFIKDGCYERIRKTGNSTKEFVFRKNDEYGRIGSSNRVVNHDKSFKKRRNSSTQIVTNLNNYPRPYSDYIDRPKEYDKLLESLKNVNIRNVQINGLGGIGKTSFIRNFCDQIEQNSYLLGIRIDFLIWITGKMTLFTPHGEIEFLRTAELNFNEMIDDICDTLSIDTYDKNDYELEKEIISTFTNYNSFLIFDNMETISDKQILKFIKTIPFNCRVVFTTRTNLTTVYERIDLDGFDMDQFKKYVINQLKNYDSKGTVSFENIETHINDLHDLIHGSPIIANMIIYKVATGYSLTTLLSELRRMKKDNNYYDKVMNFCFEDVFNGLSILEKKILFIMSISESNEEFFQTSDLKFILESDDLDIDEAISKLFNVSFCTRKDDQYSCSSLVRMFSNKKLSNEKEIEILKITDKYYEWIDIKNRFSKIEKDLYNLAKAYNFERKEIVADIRNIFFDYDIYQNYDDTINKIDEIISRNPTYAYTYFKKAQFEKNNNGDKRIVIESMNKAIYYEPNYDYYLSELAFYYSEIKDNEKAIEYFNRALKIDSHNPSTNHGVAVCYTKYYNGKPDYIDKSDIIKAHFENGYFSDNRRRANLHNVQNAHAHGRYLLSIKCYEEAIEIVRKGFQYAPNNGPLKTLYSLIQKSINPNYVSSSKVSEIRYGILTNASDEVLRTLIRISNKKDEN